MLICAGFWQFQDTGPAVDMRWSSPLWGQLFSCCCWYFDILLLSNIATLHGTLHYIDRRWHDLDMTLVGSEHYVKDVRDSVNRQHWLWHFVVFGSCVLICTYYVTLVLICQWCRSSELVGSFWYLLSVNTKDIVLLTGNQYFELFV